MDSTVDISNDELIELFSDENDIPHVKPSSSNAPTRTITSVSEKTNEMNDDELDKLLRDLDWAEDIVESKLKTPVSEPKLEHLEVLRKQFGHAKFRPMQWEIIHNIIDLKRDGCVIMATGYGKSLCYQFPPVFCNGTALVVTPLISLMEDQTLGLEAANIPACYLGAGQAGQGTKIDKIIQGDYRVVYLTPEFCTGDLGQSLFDRLVPLKRVTLVAIDEAHCVSQWGHDFRHCYRRLGKIRDSLGISIPILALTATATKQVQDDICSSLKLRNPLRICSGFDRPNLYLAVHQKGASIINDLRRHMIGGGNSFPGPTIVYCPTKKATENVAKALEDFGVNCRYYHADLVPKLRKEVHHMFVRDEIQVIVATVAFGMGIDKPDVRLIIHYGAPKDMESYYQEVGRAGRDGLQSQCYCYYATSDFNTNQYFLSNLTGQAYKHRKLAMLKMEQYLQSRQCRRQLLLSHFEPGRTKASEDIAEHCCDNCTFRYLNKDIEPEVDGLNEDGTYDFSEDAKLLLSAADFFGGRFGMAKVIDFLYGSKNNKFKDFDMKSEIFGKGKHKLREWWKGLGRMLLQEGYLEEVSSKFNAPGKFPVHTVKVARLGVNFMHRLEISSPKMNLYPSGDMLDLLKKGQRKIHFPVATTWNEPVILPLYPTISQGTEDSKQEEPKMSEEEVQKEGKLYGELLTLRNALAKQHSYMPYMVANNKTLLDVAALRPSTTSNLALVEGFNAAKIEKFGAAFVKKVQEFCMEHDLALNKIPTHIEPTVSQQKQQQSKRDFSAEYTSLSQTVQLSYDLFQKQGKDLASVAAERGMAVSTIGNHLARAVQVGLPLDTRKIGLTEDINKTILDVIRSPDINSDISRLKPIKEHCPAHISYEQIKIAIAMLALQYGIQDNILNKNTDAPDLSVFEFDNAKKKRIPSIANEPSFQQTVSPPIAPVDQQNLAKRNVDLSQFLQKRGSYSSKNDSDISAEKEDLSSRIKFEKNKIPNVGISESKKEIDIFEKVDPSTGEKKDLPSRINSGEYRIPKIGTSEMKTEVIDILDEMDPSSGNTSVPANKQIHDQTDLKRKLKDYQPEMKKKMKTSSLFRK